MIDSSSEPRTRSTRPAGIVSPGSRSMPGPRLGHLLLAWLLTGCFDEPSSTPDGTSEGATSTYTTAVDDTSSGTGSTLPPASTGTTAPATTATASSTSSAPACREVGDVCLDDADCCEGLICSGYSNECGTPP